MPFTPFHFGPGLLIKAVWPRRFSFTCYAAAQVVIDLESGYHLVRHDYPVHRWAHTYVGAAAVGLVTALAIGPAVRAWHRFVATRFAGACGGWLSAVEVSWRVIAVSTLVGTLSHVLLDSVMHSDVQPWWPVSVRNPMLGLVSVGALHLGCVLSGLGAFVYGLWKPLRVERRRFES